MGSIEEIGHSFISHYYTTLDGANYELLGSLYQANSVLTFEGQKYEGPSAIVGKVAGLGKVNHNLAGLTKDIQISTSQSAMLIFVSGQLCVDSNPPLLFSQVFQLVATGPGAFYIHNEIFRLILA